ncbi:MAG TPA: thioesterase family protein [Anaerolineales bacterium]
MSRFRFSLPLRVRHADTDAQGHVFFGNYFSYFDEAVSAYFEAIGTPMDYLYKLGLDFYYVDAHCQYKGSAKSEEKLQVDARIDRIGNTSLNVQCAIYREGHDQAIASGHVTAVLVNPKTRQPVRVPDEIRQAVHQFEEMDE